MKLRVCEIRVLERRLHLLEDDVWACLDYLKDAGIEGAHVVPEDFDQPGQRTIRGIDDEEGKLARELLETKGFDVVLLTADDLSRTAN